MRTIIFVNGTLSESRSFFGPHQQDLPDALDNELAEAIMAFCRAHVVPFQCPRTVDFVAQLPRSSAGKLLKQELRKKFWN